MAPVTLGAPPVGKPCTDFPGASASGAAIVAGGGITCDTVSDYGLAPRAKDFIDSAAVTAISTSITASAC